MSVETDVKRLQKMMALQDSIIMCLGKILASHLPATQAELSNLGKEWETAVQKIFDAT